MLSDLPWLAESWVRARALVSWEKAPPGLLIYGPRGLGRLTFARQIAQLRLCEDPEPESRPCTHCRACQQIAAGSHPDCLQIEWAGESSLIKVEAVRELCRRMALTAEGRGGRIAIVYPAERLSQASANALLKTLEEPQPGSMLILISQSVGTLPVTIVSRCQRLRIPVPDASQAVAWLQQQDVRSDWSTQLTLAEGAPMAALAQARNFPEDTTEIIRALADVAARRINPLMVSEMLAPWPLERIISLLAWLVHGSLRLRICGELPCPDWPDPFTRINAAASPRRLTRIWTELQRQRLEPPGLNAELARERLILLFVNAFSNATKKLSIP